MFITLKSVKKTFGSGTGEVLALDGVSMEIDSGESVAVHGPSGSGKSTLLNVLAGLLHPSEGEVVVDGFDLYGDLDTEGLARFRSEYIGFVFQAFNLLPYLSAFENAALPLAHLDLRKHQKREMAEAALGKVGLSDRMDHLPSELSGGQQQRVAIARAIVNRPLILMADEPTGNLDQETRNEILDLFTELNLEGQTIISVTHDPKTMAHSKRHIGIVDGRIVG